MADTGESAGGGNGIARQRLTLTDISSRAWEHPADRGALTALRQLKGYDFVLKKLAALWREPAFRLVWIGSAVRVDRHQFARVHQLYSEAAAALDVRELPDLFVYNDPYPNARTIGIDQPFIVVNSGSLALYDDDELRFVLGHELGHALSGHALYTTMMYQLLRMSNTLAWIPFGALGIRAVLAALCEWHRKAELSGDRAGLLACQDPAAAQRAHMKLAAGSGDIADLDIASFRAQGEEYLNTPDVRHSVLKLLLLEARTHPFAVVRSAELQRWIDEGAYNRVLRGNYPRRSEDADATVRADVRDAASDYKDAFERSQDPLVSILKDVGSGIAGVRDWLVGAVRPRGQDD